MIIVLSVGCASLHPRLGSSRPTGLKLGVLAGRTRHLPGAGGTHRATSPAQAALKQVPSCEFFPMQAVRTNVEGTDNVLHAAMDAGVKRVVCLSTDKAAYPINAMGISKAMMEHVIAANARVAAERSGTVICCTRYGKVVCFRGNNRG